MESLLSELLIFTAAAIIFVPLFKKLNLGAILAYLFAGIIIGPHALELVTDPKIILHFSELGVVFLLFVIGLELAPAKLWSLRKAILGLGLLQVLFTGGLFMIIAHAFGLNFNQAFVAGFGLALSSTAFSIQILEDNRQLNTTYGQGSFSILMFQDLAVVPLLAIIALLASKDVLNFSFAYVAKSAAVIILLIFLGPHLVRYGLRLVANSRTQEVFTATSLFIVLGTAKLVESIGLSMGMGAFLAGVLLANSEYRHELEVNLLPFKGLLLGLFFIAVGMSLDLNIVLIKPDIILFVTLGLISLKGLIIFVLAKLFKYPSDSSRNMAFLLSQGGEFAFVLFNTAVSNKIMFIEHASILNASVTISMALTPLIFYFNNRFLKKLSELSERKYDIIENANSSVIIAGFGRFGQVVARFLKTQDVTFTILEHDAAQVEVARKFGNKIYYGDASRKDIVESAGAKTAKIFVLAIDDVEASIATAKMVRNHFPHILIIARARNREHGIKLMELGIENIHRETLLTSLEVAKEVLLSMGWRRDHINMGLKKFRDHDESVLRNQFKIKDDEKHFISYTIKAYKELEEILSADRLNNIKEHNESTD